MDDFDGIDNERDGEFEDDDDHRLHWEVAAEEAVDEALGDVEFDPELSLVRIGETWYGLDELEDVATDLMERYDEEWYANVPFDSGEAVFESDSMHYAYQRLAAKGIYDFFEPKEKAKGEGERLVLIVRDKHDSGLLVPFSSVISMQQFGLFTSDQMAALCELIESEHCKESDLQKFFEENPQFLSRWNLPIVHPHVQLRRPKRKSLIPDFILCNPQFHKAAIIDLKLPSSKLVRNQKNRDRWANPVNEARTQLLRYRDWFDEERNRESLSQSLGMEIYKPALAVVIGRCSAFGSGFERQQLVADMPDVEVVTYDELASWADQKKLVF